MSEIGPERTAALVVGIEKYAIGSGWDLNGPARDACRFASWLCERGVLPGQLQLFVSPRDGDRDLSVPKGVQPQEAAGERIENALTRALRESKAQLLYFFWGGHGLMAEGASSQRLFYADADTADKRNLDLDAALRLLRTNYFPAPNLMRQIVVVDACANYVETRDFANQLPTTGYPYGDRVVADREQFHLFSASPGDKARNLNAEQTGLFSRELIGRLQAAPGENWPPDMEEIAKGLLHRFAELRNEGQTQQTPGYFWYRGWKGSGGALGTLNVGPRPEAGGRRPSPDELKRLSDALLACPSLETRAARDTTLRQVRRQIVTRIRHMPDDAMDMFQVVDTCANYPGGLAELIRAARTWDAGTEAMDAVDELLRQLMPDVSEQSR